MSIIELIYSFSVIAISTVMMFSNAEAPTPISDFVFKAICKLLPMFVIVFAMIQIFKHYGVI